MTYLPRRAVLYGLAAGLVLVSAQLSTTSGRASDYRVGSIVITEPWARATPKGASTGAAYMTNTGSAPDRVSCVSSEASAECQIHAMAMESGVMKMRRVEGGLEPTKSENITVTWRRSAVSWGLAPVSGDCGGAWAKPASSPIAANIFRRCPSRTPIFSRS